MHGENNLFKALGLKCFLCIEHNDDSDDISDNNETTTNEPQSV
jgi:hypothetical protein